LLKRKTTLAAMTTRAIAKKRRVAVVGYVMGPKTQPRKRLSKLTWCLLFQQSSGSPILRWPS
jgi:hypothetical protein